MINLSIENIISKLRIIGYDIIDYNDFGVIAKDNNGELVLYLIDNDNKTKIIDKDIDDFRLNSYFIITGSNNWNNISGIYTIGNRNNVIAKRKFNKVVCNRQLESTRQSEFKNDNREVLMLYKGERSIYLINGKGDLVYIGEYNIADEYYTIFYMKDVNGCFRIRRQSASNNMYIIVIFMPDFSLIERRYIRESKTDPSIFKPISMLTNYGYINRLNRVQENNGDKLGEIYKID